MSTDMIAKAYELAPGEDANEKQLDSSISDLEKSLEELIEGIDSTFNQLRGLYPDIVENKSNLQQMIAQVEKELEEKNCNNIVDAERNAAKAKKESNISGKERKTIRELFKRIATLTHEDKLRHKGLPEEEIEYLKSIFNEAKLFLEAEDRFGLEYIYTSLVAKSKKISREAIIAAKKARLKSLNQQRMNVERSFEGQLHRMYDSDKPRAENLYLDRSKKELQMLAMRLKRLHLLNKAEFVSQD